MPKSKHRKNRRKFRGKFSGTYGVPDPASLFFLIGKEPEQGGLDEDERSAAAQLLFKEMNARPAGYDTLRQYFGDDWPPKTADDLIKLSRLVQEEPRAPVS